MTTLALMIFTYFRNTYHRFELFYISLYVVATLYSLGWDYYMDWGLLQGKKKGRRLLRDNLKYPTHFYYFSMVTNLFLRFAWILTLVPSSWFPKVFVEA
jgi:hypothetical protein